MCTNALGGMVNSCCLFDLRRTGRGELEFHGELWGECLQETSVSRINQWRVPERGGGILWNKFFCSVRAILYQVKKRKSTHQVSNFNSRTLLLTKMIHILRDFSWGQQESLQLPIHWRSGKKSWNQGHGTQLRCVYLCDTQEWSQARDEAGVKVSLCPNFWLSF